MQNYDEVFNRIFENACQHVARLKKVNEVQQEKIRTASEDDNILKSSIYYGLARKRLKKILVRTCKVFLPYFLYVKIRNFWQLRTKRI